MARKKKIDPQVQRMMESFNRKPTAAEEADFYKRNAGGPMAMTSMTRGRGYCGVLHEPDHHVASYFVALMRVEMYGHWAGPPWQQALAALFYDDSGD